jgi:hypothetical protein
MSNYTKGSSANIIVGAAALFVGGKTDEVLAAEAGKSYKETLSTPGTNESPNPWTNVGYTANGLELTFQPDFGEVKVDQVLDVAKLFKQGMKVELKTTFAEATLENLLISVAAAEADLKTSATTGDDANFHGSNVDVFTMKAGELGEYPLERQLIAVGASLEPGTVDTAGERVYLANRVLSIQNVTVSAKRDAATEFEVTFRLLPNDTGVYGKIVDRTYSTAV